MALAIKDRVKETTTTTGTGDYTLGGAVTGFETFGSVGDGNTTYYVCTDNTSFEIGIGTYTASGTTLARTTILQAKDTYNTTTDQAVDWPSGTRTIFCTYPADKAVFKDASGHITIPDDKKLYFGTGEDAYLEYDEDGTDKLIIKGNTTFLDGAYDFDIASHDGSNGLKLGGTLVTSSAAELNILDGKSFVDEDNMASDLATAIASQQSIKAYVDSQVTAQDLDFQGDSGGALSIDLDSETLDIAGGTGIDTSGSSNTLTVAIDSTVATLSGTQTLTNKTLTSPKINEDVAVTSTATELNLLDGVSGLVQADFTKLAAVDSTATELNIVDGNTSIGTTAVSDGHGIVMNHGGTMAQTTVQTLSAYLDDEITAMPNLTSVGTLTALSVDSSVAIDDKVITMTGSSGDTFTTTVGTNGATSLVTVDTAGAAAHLEITADGTVDINSAGVLTLDSGAAINIEPASGSVILLDGTISVDAGVVTGATSIISTAFVGDITGDVTGNADTATALATGRTIGMTGDVVWTSASFTGAGNVTGSATIQAGAVENSMLADDAVGADELASDAVVNASVASSAAIAFSKMADLTASRALVSDGSGDVSVSAVTSTEVGYLDGVTSAIQTQIDAKTTATAASNEATALAIALG